MAVNGHAFYTSELCGRGWSPSRSGRFVQRKAASDIQQIASVSVSNCHFAPSQPMAT